MKIIIIEDSAKVRESLVRLLKHIFKGIQIVECDSVFRAKNLISNGKYDLAILDLNLPDGSGTELIELFKEVGNTKVLIFSNTSSDYIRSRCLNQGADYFFDKSSELDKLISTLEDLQPVM